MENGHPRRKTRPVVPHAILARGKRLHVDFVTGVFYAHRYVAGGKDQPIPFAFLTAEVKLAYDALLRKLIGAHEGRARYASIDSWVYTDVKGWTLADTLDDAQFAVLLAEAETMMQPVVNGRGNLSFSAPAHIVSATKS